MSAVERVTYVPHDSTRRRTVLLTDVADLTMFGESAIRGVEVDRDGVRKAPSRAYLARHGVEDGEIVHIIMTALIESRTPMRQDLTYGGLVPA